MAPIVFLNLGQTSRRSKRRSTKSSPLYMWTQQDRSRTPSTPIWSSRLYILAQDVKHTFQRVCLCGIVPLISGITLTKKPNLMRRKIAVASTAILISVGSVKSQDTLVSAFFGLDNALPGLLCNQPGSLLDGMPVNFQFPLDASSLSETDFEVLDNLGNVHTSLCFVGPGQ